jgi:hypothetical protein
MDQCGGQSNVEFFFHGFFPSLFYCIETLAVDGADRILSSVGDFLGLDVLRSLTTGFSTAEIPGDPLPPEMANSCPKLTSAVLTGLISESSSRILALGDEKFAQPSSTLGFGLSKGLSKGVTVEAAKGLESQGLPVSMATSPETEPDSMTSEPELLSL